MGGPRGGGGGIWLQRGLGLLTWTLLALALLRVTPLVRAQTLVVVAFATVVEYVFSPTLHVYTYRFDNVPAYVPPGHGLVYLSAFARPRRVRAAPDAHVGAGRAARRGAWAAHGVLLAERPDALGAFWFACLVLFLAFGPSKPVYVGAFVVVAGWRLLGTHLGNWEWGRTDFTGWVDRQPAVGRRRWLRVVRPGGPARRAPAAGDGQSSWDS